MNRLALRIQEELGDIEIGLQRTHQGWQKFQISGDELYIDSVALNLQSIYTGLERLFEQISREIDNSHPSGVNWHELLLIQMAQELEGRRPAVISDDSRNALDEYRRFRHVVRHSICDEFKGRSDT